MRKVVEVVEFHEPLPGSELIDYIIRSAERTPYAELQLTEEIVGDIVVVSIGLKSATYPEWNIRVQLNDDWPIIFHDRDYGRAEIMHYFWEEQGVVDTHLFNSVLAWAATQLLGTSIRTQYLLRHGTAVTRR